MANVNEIVMCVKWSGRLPECGLAPVNCTWEDITGQPTTILPCTPNVYLIRAFVTDPVYASINGDARFIVLARRQYDDQNSGVYLINNFDDVPTTIQLNNLKNLIISRFPGVNEDALTEAGQAIFRSGISRAEAIALLAARWQRFVKAVS